MDIKNNVLRHHLRNCYFITGTAYAGKSTLCAMLAEKHGMIHCGENYGLDEILSVADPENQPNVSYMNTKPSWEHFVSRTPEEYESWVEGNARELADFEVAYLLSLPRDKKVIVDTNIPLDLLRQISDYSHVALMLSPLGMSAERFFDRDDPEKQFLLSVIRACPDPEKTLANFKACIARINGPEVYQSYLDSGFFTLVREDDGRDTRQEMLKKLEEHFGLSQE